MTAINIIWFRRDLRLHDNAALFHALNDKNPLLPVFIFDRNILDELTDRTDRRVEFIHEGLQQMQKRLIELGSTLDVRYGFPEKIFQQLAKEYTIEKVFTQS
jgi:deoxyribodipyrimidine photo-lyase